MTHHKTSIFMQLCLIIIMAFGLTWHIRAATEFKIITLHYRFAEEILPAIQPLVGENGTATAAGNNLIIRTSPENMAEIEQIVNTLDTERKNLKITISRNKNQVSETNRAAISGRQRIGNVTIETGDGRRIIRDGVAVNIENQQNRNSISNNQFIQVLDGQSAFISVGQSIPYTQEWVSLTQRYIHVQRSTQFVNIDTGFTVRPRSIGSLIELEVTPRFSQLNQNGFIDFETLSTVIRAKRGEWVDLGGTMQQKDEVSRAILSWQGNNQSADSQLLIKVD